MNLLERLLANYIEPEDFLSVYDELQDLYKDKEYFSNPNHRNEIDDEEYEYMEADIKEDEEQIFKFRNMCHYSNWEIDEDIPIIREYVLSKNPNYNC